MRGRRAGVPNVGPEMVERIVDMARRGVPATQIAVLLGPSEPTVRRHLKAAGVKLRVGRRERIVVDLDAARALIADGLTIRAAAAQLGLTADLLGHRLGRKQVKGKTLPVMRWRCCGQIRPDGACPACGAHLTSEGVAA